MHLPALYVQVRPLSLSRLPAGKIQQEEGAWRESLSPSKTCLKGQEIPKSNFIAQKNRNKTILEAKADETPSQMVM